MNRIKCFYLERTDECAQWLRVYDSDTECTDPESSMRFHEAKTRLPNGRMVVRDEIGWPGRQYLHRVEDGAEEGYEYPTHCKCGYEFGPKATRHLFSRSLYADPEGQLMTLEDAPVGAMWDAFWTHKNRKGPDGRSLHVKTPGGEWCIDSKASNCTLPEDWTHRCWIRHGEPPEITVDKNGHTCAAGAGSIALPGYHGFLRAGYLEQC